MAIVDQFLRSFKDNFPVSIKFMIGMGIGSSLPSKRWELEKLVSEANTVFDRATISLKSPIFIYHLLMMILILSMLLVLSLMIWSNNLTVAEEVFRSQ